MARSAVIDECYQQTLKPQHNHQQMVEENSMRPYSQSDFELLNLLQHPIWIFDAARKEMFWANRAALVIWSAANLTELLSRDFKTGMTEATEARISTALKNVTNGEIIHDQYTFYPCGNNTTVYVTGSAIRIRHNDQNDDKDNLIAILVESQKIVDQDKEAQDEVTRAVEMLRHLSMPVCQFDMEGKLQYQNPKAECLFNSTERDDSKDFHKRFVDKELAKVVLQKVQNGNDYSTEAEHYTLDGPRWFFVTVKRARDPVSSESIVLYSAQDITEVVEARNERITVHEKSEFFAVIAHEIRTPLHQIIGYLDLLELDGLGENQIEMLRTIQSSSALLMSIINDLLDYTKLENGKLQLELIRFQIRDVVKSCLATVEAGARTKGLTIIDNIGVENSHDLPDTLIGDPNRVRQILLNFLSNAIKFTDKGKILVNISVISSSPTADKRMPNRPNMYENQSESSPESMLAPLSSVEKRKPTASTARNAVTEKKNSVVVRFEVSDTGIGIDPKHQATLFRKYQQGNSSISRNYGGTGLGLAICKSLADLMGARIGLTSEVGAGTTAFFEVSFEIPTAICSPPLDGQELQPFLPLTLKESKLHILVVEDNAINRKMVCAMLKKLGYDVSVAENGQVAVDMVLRECYNIILMDVQMPVMDGIEATKKIRGMKSKQYKDLTIIGLTAAYESSDLDYYTGIGMNNCIGKPVRLVALKEAINASICSVSPQSDQ